MAFRHILAAMVPRLVVLKVKYLKQALHRIRTHKKKINTNIEYTCISKPNTHVFFGYYDISPFNKTTDEIIYNNLIESENKLHLFLSTLSDKQEHEIADTRAWNWQQGCRLRWMPNNNREVVFNDFDGNGYFARILNVDTKEERRLCAPLYDISPDGRFGLSIDFERLGVKRPGYGYTCRDYVESQHNLLKESIDLIDLDNNTRKVVLTYEDIIDIPGCNTGDACNNYINHLCFSPSGRQFLFFWLTADRSCHKAFLLVHNLDTKETKLLEGSLKVSHYVWQDEDNIVCTAFDDNKQCRYYIYNVPTCQKQIMNPAVLNVDGHPSIYSDTDILTDTYPNLNGFQRLYIADKQDGGYKQLLEIYSNCCIEGEKRTDLHPRLDASKKIVCIDVNYNRYRNLLYVSI